MARTCSVQKPDDQDDGTFCGSYQECLAWLAKECTPTEIDEDNANAQYHGWQIAEIDDEDDYCYDETSISGEDISGLGGRKMRYEIMISTNKRDYASRELVTGDIIVESPAEAIESFWEALRDKAADNSQTLDFDGNRVYEVDNETGERDDEYYLKDTAEAVIIPAQVSIDNGASFTTPGEALKAVGMATLAELMNDECREAVHGEMAPCTEEEFLTRYLEIAPADLIIG